jgi:hypothetical protein
VEEEKNMGIDVFVNVVTGTIAIKFSDGTSLEISRQSAYRLAQALNRAADQASGGGQQSR